jgi:hypothetical protein
MKFSLGTKSIGQAFSLVRLVKPESGDFCLRFEQDGVIVFSNDKRRYIRTFVDYNGGSDSSIKSEDLYITPDKTALLDISDLRSVTITINEKSVSLKAEGGGQSRQASMKKKARRSKRPPIPDLPVTTGIKNINRESFEKILRSLSCSAQVKLKSEEEMRVNQVHFYSGSQCAISDARHYGTVIQSPLIDFDLSLVGADLPVISSFCSNCKDDYVSIVEDKNKLYIIEPGTRSILALSKISSKKPLFTLESDDYPISFVVDAEKLSKALSWAMTASQEEGTRRVSFRISGEGRDRELILLFNKEEISRVDCRMDRGHTFDEDVHVEYLERVTGNVNGHDEGGVRFSFGHKDSPNTIRISSANPTGDILTQHYLQTMVKH